MSRSRRVASLGDMSGAVQKPVEKRQSLEVGVKTVPMELYFVGLVRGEEYTPIAGGGRVCPIHGFAKLIVGGVQKFQNEYSVLRFKALRFAREMELNTFYKFTKFFLETWKPLMLPIGEQTEMHSFYLSEFNLSTDLCGKLEASEKPFIYDASLLLRSISSIVAYFAAADPAAYGKDQKPLVCTAFKVISAFPDTIVGQGLLRSAWRIGDGHESMFFSVVGQNRSRCAVVVGKCYRAFGCCVYYSGNAAPSLQPTIWGHVELVDGETAYADVEIEEAEDDSKKNFVVTMLKFVGIQMVCAASDCQQLVNVATGAKMLICTHCGCSFRPDAKQFQVKLLMNVVENEPVTTQSGERTTVLGPRIDNLRISNYTVAQKLLGIERPEKLLEKPKDMQKVSAHVMKALFEFEYDSSSLLVSNVRKHTDPPPGLFSEEEETEESDVSSGDKKRGRKRGGRDRKKGKKMAKKMKAKKKRTKRQKGKKRRRQESSSSSSTDEDCSSEEDDQSDASSTLSLRGRVAARQRGAEEEAQTLKEKGGQDVITAEDGVAVSDLDRDTPPANVEKTAEETKKALEADEDEKDEAAALEKQKEAEDETAKSANVMSATAAEKELSLVNILATPEELQSKLLALEAAKQERLEKELRKTSAKERPLNKGPVTSDGNQ